MANVKNAAIRENVINRCLQHLVGRPNYLRDEICLRLT